MSPRTVDPSRETGRYRTGVASPPQVDTIERRVPRPTVAATPSLLYWRMQRGWIQKDLGERAGVDRATVARLEAGGQARLDTISKLAQALSIEPGDLFRQPPQT